MAFLLSCYERVEPVAVMIPDRIETDIPSTAERRIFEVIHKDLGSEWYGLHSLGLARHSTLPWAEIDFVLIGPTGVFCLEVKGGRVAFKDGLWEFTNKHGEVAKKRRGPFEQVGPASSALYNYLRQQLPPIDLLVGYGVVTPDIRFNISGPDIISEIVYDERDRTHSFGRYLERLAAYWRERLRRAPRRLASPQISAIRDRLRGDFDLRPSLRARVQRSTEELLSLTVQQYQILNGLVDNPRVIISGGAGTGKTLLAVEEAQRQAARGKSVAFFCFNRRLASFLRQAMANEPSCVVDHLHGFMAQTVRDADFGQRIDRQDPNVFSEIYPDLTLEILLDSNQFQYYDVLIVDEAQDLMLNSYLNVFDAVVKGGLREGEWRFFIDPNQNIYDGIEEAALQRLDSTRPARFKLGTNCRNTAPIAVTTALISGIHDTSTLKVGGPDVEEHWYRDEQHERTMISRCLRHMLGDGIIAGDITILSPRRLERSVLRLGLADVPASVVEDHRSHGGSTGACRGLLHGSRLQRAGI